MMEVATRALLEDMLLYARRALERLSSGEAASQLPASVREQHGQIAFEAARYMRNRLVHGYHTIKLDIVIDTVRNDLPPLIIAIERLLAQEP